MKAMRLNKYNTVLNRGYLSLKEIKYSVTFYVVANELTRSLAACHDSKIHLNRQFNFCVEINKEILLV